MATSLGRYYLRLNTTWHVCTILMYIYILCNLVSFYHSINFNKVQDVLIPRSSSAVKMNQNVMYLIEVDAVIEAH